MDITHALKLLNTEAYRFHSDDIDKLEVSDLNKHQQTISRVQYIEQVAK